MDGDKLDRRADPNRGTGRTYTAVAACIVAAREGKHVAYIVHNYPMFEHVKWIVGEVCTKYNIPRDTFSVPTSTFHFEGGGKLTIINIHTISNHCGTKFHMVRVDHAVDLTTIPERDRMIHGIR